MTLKRALAYFNIILAGGLALALIWKGFSLYRSPLSQKRPENPPLAELTRQRAPHLDTTRDLFGTGGAPGKKDETSPEGERQEVQMPTHTIRLEGIILVDQKRIAIMNLIPKTPGKQRKVERIKLKAGDPLLGFTVVRIEQDRVLLLDEARQEEKTLIIFKKSTTEG